MADEEPEMFSSRLGLILTTIGAAVGTGNIWRFPREAAANGGGAFMIGWLLFLFAWSIPLLMAEFAIGKKTRLGTVGAMRDMAGRNFTWLGIWMMWVGTAVGFYYAVVMGWTIRYFWIAISGDMSDATDTEQTQALWDDFISSPAEVVFFQLIAVAFSAFIVYYGISGIEKANMILIPCLVAFLIVAMIYPFILNPSGAIMGLKFLFIPQGEYLFKGETWIRALTQSAWSTSMRKKEDIGLNAFLTGLGNNSVSLIAGVAVLGTVFALSDSTAEGLEAVESGSSGLTFIHLTALFASMGTAGWVIGSIFFLAMSFAALTSMVSTLQGCVVNFVDMGWERKEAVRYIAVAVAFAGIPAAISLEFLDNQDFVWGTGLIVSGLMVAIVVMKFGVSNFRKNLINTEYADVQIGVWWEYIIKYVFPIEFIAVFGFFIYEKLQDDSHSPIEGMGLGLFTIITMIVQWAIVLIIFIVVLNNRVADSVKKGPVSDGNFDDDVEWAEDV
ncbi:MAG: sodium-dependent transporter [Methanobacteriota archaeon]|nr:MAG: sodium-dependent transporter [Euryarchaeota archaeon]